MELNFLTVNLILFALICSVTYGHGRPVMDDEGTEDAGKAKVDFTLKAANTSSKISGNDESSDSGTKNVNLKDVENEFGEVIKASLKSIYKCNRRCKLSRRLYKKIKQMKTKTKKDDEWKKQNNNIQKFTKLSSILKKRNYLKKK